MLEAKLHIIKKKVFCPKTFSYIPITECLKCNDMEQCYKLPRYLLLNFIKQEIEHSDDNISASDIASCLTKKFYAHKEPSLVDQEIIRTMIRGQVIHRGLQSILFASDYKEEKISLKLSSGVITGHPDLIFDNSVYEIKTTNEFKEVWFDWLVQLAIYKLATNVEKAYLLVYSSKNDQFSKFQIIVQEEKFLDWLDERLRLFKEAIQENNISILKHHARPLSRHLCPKCPFYSKCRYRYKVLQPLFIRYKQVF